MSEVFMRTNRSQYWRSSAGSSTASSKRPLAPKRAPPPPPLPPPFKARLWLGSLCCPRRSTRMPATAVRAFVYDLVRVREVA